MTTYAWAVIAMSFGLVLMLGFIVLMALAAVS